MSKAPYSTISASAELVGSKQMNNDIPNMACKDARMDIRVRPRSKRFRFHAAGTAACTRARGVTENWLGIAQFDQKLR